MQSTLLFKRGKNLIKFFRDSSPFTNTIQKHINNQNKFSQKEKRTENDNNN